MSKPIYNCHTHIFTMHCAPPYFHGKGFGKVVTAMLNNPRLPDRLIRLLDRINPFTNKDKFSRYANFIRIGKNKQQDDIFRNLTESSREFGDMRYIVLTLDMDHMQAGDAPMNFLTQVDEVAELKRMYPQHLFPFFSIDPRRGSADYLKKLAEQYIEKRGFSGIKLYPSLGFFPFHPKLKPLYRYCITNQIPIMTHCDTGGIYYQGAIDTEHYEPSYFTSKKPYTHLGGSDDQSKFKNHFIDPVYFESILKEPDFNNLKICLAHYGGVENIEKKGSWYDKIRELMSKYDQVYTDVSYTLWATNNDKVMNKIKDDIDDPKIGSRILFGTDFYMTIRKKNEKQLISDFIKSIGEDRFTKIARDNPLTYLSSEFVKI